MPRPRLWQSVAPALLALALVALAGCQRKPQFVPASADTSIAGRRDSLAQQVQALQERWSEGGAGEDAARLTAQALLRDLRARPSGGSGAAWEERARALLDSLDVGAEFASAPCALVVNFFARSDPEAGSWPWAFWCAGGTRDSAARILAQAVEGQSLSLVALASRGLGGPPRPASPPAIAALFTRRSGSGQQPLLMAWRAGARLDLAQTLGADSLGGVGTGSFESPGDSGIVLTTRTWQPTPQFDECATCPHVFRVHRFRWSAAGFQRFADEVIPSPYTTFTQLIRALVAGDHGQALGLVSGPAVLEAAVRAGWATYRGVWRAAPESEEAGDVMDFYRGTNEAWKVRFVRRGNDWLVDSLEPTTQVIE